MSTCTRPLGRSDVEVSTIAMGCWAIVGDATWGSQDEADATEAIRAAIDHGVTFFDTAEGYGAGASEKLLAKGLGKDRDKVIIGSKVSPSHTYTYKDLVHSCDISLANLRTDYIDVYHLHWPNRQTPVAEILEGFQRLRQQGKIRAVGVSNFGPDDLRGLLDVGRCDVNQLPCNLLWRAIEFEVAPICREHEIAVTCYCPIAQGLLTGKFAGPDDVPEGRARTRHFSRNRAQARHDQAGAEGLTFETIGAISRLAADVGCSMTELALAWLLAKPGIASVLVGARNARQMTENARAMHRRLSVDLIAALDQASAPLKQHFGPDPDMWQSPSRYR